MVRRSVLFTPGDRPEMMEKAPDAGADVVVFDLEDAVAPARKADARETVRSVLASSSFDPGCEVCVRVNASGEAARADLDAIVDERARLDSVIVPKAGSADDVRDLAVKLDSRGQSIPILAIVESARGVLAAEEIAAVPETDALIFGAEDLAADVGASRTNAGTEVLYARQRTVLAAAAHGCDAIDTLHTDFTDDEGLIEDARVSVQFGYDGKLAIHPAQVDPINEAFSPDAEQLEWAEAVLAKKRDADAAGRGVFEVDGEMIDAPLIARAERILERAKAAGLRE